YVERIREFWRAERATLRDVTILVRPATPVRRDTVAAPAPVAAEAPMAASVVRPAADDGDFGAPLDGRYLFDTFIVGKSNELAHAAARRVAEADAVPFNPLFLYGGVGLGKTHLMHAIAWHIRQKHPQRKVIYLSAEKFMYQFVRAVRFKDTMAFKQ